MSNTEKSMVLPKVRKVTYHNFHSYIADGKKITCITQLYKVGVYAIINNDPALQFNWTPMKIRATEKKLRKQEADGNITDLVFGREMVVSDSTGFWEEVV